MNDGDFMSSNRTITECYVAQIINGKETEDLLEDFYLKPCFKELMHKLLKDILKEDLEDRKYILRIKLEAEVLEYDEDMHSE